MRSSAEKRGWLNNIMLNIAGVIFALLVAELALSLFATGKGGIPAPDESLVAKPGSESERSGQNIQIRQFQEGFGIANFAPDGRRLTGHDNVAGAPSGILIGDSFVEALQVNDDETMGSQIERISAAANSPVNVRQYGWGGTSIATYLAVSEAINKKWDPEWVAVLFNDDDFTEQSFSTGRFWKMEIDQLSGQIRVVPVPRTGSSLDPILARVGLTSSDLRSWLNRSTLGYLSVEKYLLSTGDNRNSSVELPDTGAELEKQKVVATEMVRSLKHAYPKGLLVVFVPQMDATSENTPLPIEQILASTCQDQDVDFLSTRSAMIDLRDRNHTLPEGFVNTVPGGGHLNRLGHQIVANEIWRVISRNKQN
jgi:hypothetical protein